MLTLLVLTAALLPKQTAYAYTAPEFRDAQFHEAAAMIGDRVKLDVSCLAEGYVAVSAVSDMRLKFQVVKDETTYNYDLPSDGTPGIFPLQGGNGSYRFRVMENVGDKKYSGLYSFTCDVVMQDEFQPFLRPSTYINYNRDSACVRKAAELAAAASDELGLVSAVYNYVCGQVTYDREKAASVKSGYLPVPDETMTSGKGICYSSDSAFCPSPHDLLRPRQHPPSLSITAALVTLPGLALMAFCVPPLHKTPMILYMQTRILKTGFLGNIRKIIAAFS